jgi:hypothetical protein
MPIHVYAVERRTMKVAGKAPVTITRETVLQNGKGRKTVKVTRGSRTLSSKTERLNLTECKRIGKRKYVKGLYKPMEAAVLRQLN